MHLPHWTPFKLFKSHFKPVEGNLAQVLQQSGHCQMLFRPQKPSRLTISTSATEVQATIEEDEREAREEASIMEAYRIARIARSRLQKEAERKDHNLRCLVGHANLLDHLAETIEEVEPDFDIDDLEPYIEAPVICESVTAKPIRRGHVDAILRSIDLPEDADDEILDDDDEDEVYDESDDDLDDPPTPPSTPEQAEFGGKQDYSALLTGYGLSSNVEFSVESNYGQDDDSCIVAEQSCVEYTPPKTIRRMKRLPIITITALGEDT
ncbi:hypothetical protein CKM354_000824800 [Cercospora kikuchii]|uniref:Uncharacterized protein n=1 Tax=Cercospora kikuchii TaxID=84275 RepID=A0A9P3CLL3_9PEZI|nr:uncharacterized protein CKM354_000824800 [Cercospora kikuchii]GIZ45064.1 hypothetical protein CKM354_000824800 [Cercospora kikuchii]